MGCEACAELDPLPAHAGHPFPLRGLSARGWERLPCLCPGAAGACLGCSCCTLLLVLAASTPSCIPYQLVSSLALLCLAKLHPLLPFPLPLPTLSGPPVCMPGPAACSQPSGSGDAGGACWGGERCQQALAALQNHRQGPRCPPAAPVSSGRRASSSRGTATEESSSPLRTVWQHQSAWGSLPRDKGHTWCAPHGAGCSQRPRSQCWHKQPHACAHDGMLLRAGTCTVAGDTGLCRGAVGCCSVTSPLKHSCPAPVPRAVHLLLRGAQPGNDPAGMGAALDFICKENFFHVEEKPIQAGGAGRGLVGFSDVG